MKMLLCHCAGSCYYDASTDVYHQTNAAEMLQTIYHFFVSGIGQKKPSMQLKFVAAQKMLLKQNPANIRKWIARFYYFRHLYSAEARVYCSQ